MEVKLTPNKLVILKALETQTVMSWSNLRTAYFGPARAQATASTAFYQQLKGCMEGGLVVKEASGYKITDIGLKAITAVREAGNIDVDSLESEAAKRFAANPVLKTLKEGKAAVKKGIVVEVE